MFEIKDRVMRLIQGNPVSLGLDIGNHSVKIVEIVHHPNGPILTGAGIHVFKMGTMVKGQIRNKDELLKAIRSLIHKTSPSNKRKEVNFALSWSYGVLADRMKVRSSNLDSDEEVILTEASQHSPFDVEDIQLDYKIIHKNETTQDMEVLIVAAKDKMMDPYIGLIREAGLDPINVDVDSFAVANAYLHKAPEENLDKVICLANIGEHVTNLTFIKHGDYHSTRDIPVGGNNFVRVLEENLEVSALDAAAILKGHSQEGYDVDAYNQCIDTSVQELAEGLQLALSYFQSSEQNLPVDKVILSGGGACIENLESLLGGRLGIPTRIADPLGEIQADKKKFPTEIPREISTTLTVATGLALRKF